MAFKVATGVIEFTTKGLAGATSALRSLGSSITGLLKSPLLAGGGLLGGFFAGKAILDEATKAIDSMARLDAVLRATGNTTGFTLRQLSDMAGELQNVTTFGDDATNAAQGILAMFDLTGKEFRRTLELSQDMASFFDGDLSASAKALGLALNDPAQKLSMLDRQLGLFGKQAVDKISDMAKAGDLVGARLKIFEALEGAVGGVARAVAATPIGKLKQLMNVIGDLAENVGIGFLQRVSSMIGDMTTAMTRLGPIALQVGAALGDVVVTIGDLLSFLSGGVSLDLKKPEEFIQLIRRFLVTIVPRIRIVLLNISLAVQETIDKIVNSVVDAAQKIADTIGAIFPGAAGIKLEKVQLFDTDGTLKQIDALEKLIEDRLKNLAPLDLLDLVAPDGGQAPGGRRRRFAIDDDGAAAAGSLTQVGAFFRTMQERLLGTAGTEEAKLAQEQVKIQNDLRATAKDQFKAQDESRQHLKDLRDAFKQFPAAFAAELTMR